MEDQKNKKDEIIQEIEKLSKVENKIVFLLDKMQEALRAQPLDFKFFWEIKAICLNLFKENISMSLRARLWDKYLEILNESKKVKDVIDDQNAFAIEQIELTIDVLEKDLKNFDDLLKNIKPIDIAMTKAFESNLLFFIDIQKELTLLNSFAIRVNSLRKEIIKISMKIKTKSSFFTRLSSIGDQIFPKRKEKINLLSLKFSNAIDEYIGDLDDQKAPYYVLKQEIKELQNLAKTFTINTNSFTDSRIKLSKYWDKIKESEKVYKKNQLKSKDNAALIEEKIKEFKILCKSEPKKNDAFKKEKELIEEVKKADLLKGDVFRLKRQIEDAKKNLFEEEKQKREEISKKLKEEKNNREKEIENLKLSIQNLVNNNKLDIEEISTQKKSLEEKMQKLNLSKLESLMLSMNLSKLQDSIEEKELTQLVDSTNLNELKDLFEKKAKKRIEIKNKYEDLRKELNGSNFDFERAIVFRDLIDFQKSRLDKINFSIEELELKIINLENS